MESEICARTVADNFQSRKHAGKVEDEKKERALRVEKNLLDDSRPDVGS